MIRFKTLSLGAAAMLLTACTVPPLPAPPPYASGRPKAEQVSVGHTVEFTPGAVRMGPVERLRLEKFLRDMALDRHDHVRVVAGNDPQSARRRAEVSGYLDSLGVPVEPPRRPADAEAPAGSVAVIVERVVVEIPTCGSFPAEGAWQQAANMPSPNFGCATARNLALQVQDRRDLIAGRPEGLANGEMAARAVEAYRTGQVKELPDPNSSENTMQLPK